jgi:mRNA interferase MazF
LSVATVIPTSTSAAASLARPAFVIAGRQSRLLVDQIRTVDVDYIVGEPVDYLDHGQMLEVEWAMARYLGLIRPLEPRPDPP